MHKAFDQAIPHPRIDPSDRLSHCKHTCTMMHITVWFNSKKLKKT